MAAPAPMGSVDPHRGRAVVRTGLALLAVAALLSGTCIAYGLVFASRVTRPTTPFLMPGEVSAELTPGEWALYSVVDGGRHASAAEQQIAIDGPAPVKVRSTGGFYSDVATIVVDDRSYAVFARLTITTPGRYDIKIEKAQSRGVEPAVVGPYIDSLSTALWVILGVVVGFLVGTAAAIVLLVGLLIRRSTKKRLAAIDPQAAGGYYGSPGPWSAMPPT